MKLLKRLSTLVLAGTIAASAASIVERRGAVRTSGNKIVDQSGKQIQLTGMSLYWSIWGGESYYTQSTVDWLVRDWKINGIRAAMAVEASGGYLNPANRRSQLRYVNNVVEAAVKNGIYVVIDYHSHQAIENVDTAVKFFDQMAQKYGDLPNVIFEIYNEPSSNPSGTEYEWPQIKAYAEAVIPAIRKHSNNLVIVGTPKWSGYLADAKSEPLDPTAFPNVAYTFHFYACTHRINNLEVAQINAIPVFITEWGATGADGGADGQTCLDAAEKAAYKTTRQSVGSASVEEWYSSRIDAYKLSSMNWSVNNIKEASAALAGSSGPEGFWDVETGLSRSGKWVRNMIREHCAKDSTTCPWLGDTLVPKVHELPASIPAVEYVSQMGTARQTDPAGGQILINVGNGDGVRYRVHAASADSLVFRLRMQSEVSGSVQVLVDGAVLDSIWVRPTGGRFAWFQSLNLSKVDTGSHEIALQFSTEAKNAFQISTIEVKKQGVVVQTLPAALDLSKARKLVNVGLGSDNDSGALFLQNFLAGSQAQYLVETANADSVDLQVLAVNLTGKPARLVLKTSKNLLLFRTLDTLEIPVDGKGTLLKTRLGFGTAGLQYLQISSLDIVDPGVYIMGIGAGKEVGIKNQAQRLGSAPALRRFGERLELDLTGWSGAAAVTVVGADGRRILSREVEAGALVGLDLPRTLRPQWIRVQGMGQAVLSVPPGF